MEKNLQGWLGKIETASQLDVAVRQLCTAVKMFFADDDAFSMYSLVRNSEEIISGLLRDKGEMSLWNSALENQIKPEYRKMVRKWCDDERNDLKHRTHKENEMIELHLGNIEFFLMVGVNALHTHYPEIFLQKSELVVFNIWCRTNHPEIFEHQMNWFEGDELLSKQEFFTKHLPFARDFQQSKGVIL